MDTPVSPTLNRIPYMPFTNLCSTPNNPVLQDDHRTSEVNAIADDDATFTLVTNRKDRKLLGKLKKLNHEASHLMFVESKSNQKDDTGEKRVLQPKKQETIVKGTATSSTNTSYGLVEAAKDKRKVNQKVKRAVSTMAFIIPDKTLGSLVCNSCYKYLSVRPVKIYRNGDIKCGRCAATETPYTGVLSLVNHISDYCLYKCINRFDGCRKLLSSSQMLSHEKTCTSKVYHKCPVCKNGDVFTSLLLERHFLVEHEITMLEYKQFTVNLTSLLKPLKMFCYSQKDFLFLISFRYNNHSGGEIRLRISLVGTIEQTHKITPQCWITSPDNHTVDFVIKNMFCTTIDVESNWFCIEELDFDNTKSILVKFELQFNDLQCVQIPNSVGAAETSRDSAVEQYDFFW